jgi:ABC-type phosphate transport system auxiliary subunit
MSKSKARERGSDVITQAMMQVAQDSELRKLVKRREQLRGKLKDHFSQPISQRNYMEFESVVDQLDDVRKKIHDIKIK